MRRNQTRIRLEANIMIKQIQLISRLEYKVLLYVFKYCGY